MLLAHARDFIVQPSDELHRENCVLRSHILEQPPGVDGFVGDHEFLACISAHSLPGGIGRVGLAEQLREGP